MRVLSSKEKYNEESIIDKKIEDVIKRMVIVEKEVNKNGATLNSINGMLEKLMKFVKKTSKSRSSQNTRLRKDFFSRIEDIEKSYGETVKLFKVNFKELGFKNDEAQKNILLIKEEKIPQGLSKLKSDLLTRLDEVNSTIETHLENLTTSEDHLSTMFQEYTTGYVTDKIELNERFVVLDKKIAEEISNLHDNISDRFKATEDNMIENLRQMIVKSDEAQQKIIENLESANQNIQDMRETYRAEFSTQLDEFEKTYTILSELVADFNKARESQAESGKKVTEIYDTIHWKFETLRDELSSRFEVLERRVNDSLDQLLENFNSVSIESEKSLRTLHQTIDSLKIAYVDRLTKNLEALSLDIDTTKNAIISAIPTQSMTLDSDTLVGVKKILENSSKDLGDKLRTLKEEQVSLVNIQANLVSTLREYRTMLQELRITLLDKMEEFEKLMIR